jgi:hypothetical protein
MSKWPLRSELPPLPRLIPKHGVVSPIVVGWVFVIALMLSFVVVSYVIGTEPTAMLRAIEASAR